MEFINERSGNGGLIKLMKESTEIGRLTYTIQPEKSVLIISYVLVYPQYNGKGYGKALVENGVEFARQNQWTINPHCSYARSVLMRMQGVEDVFPK